jgi:hypothetical protein
LGKTWIMQQSRHIEVFSKKAGEEDELADEASMA